MNISPTHSHHTCADPGFCGDRDEPAQGGSGAAADRCRCCSASPICAAPSSHSPPSWLDVGPPPWRPTSCCTRPRGRPALQHLRGPEFAPQSQHLWKKQQRMKEKTRCALFRSRNNGRMLNKLNWSGVSLLDWTRTFPLTAAPHQNIPADVEQESLCDVYKCVQSVWARSELNEVHFRLFLIKKSDKNMNIKWLIQKSKCKTFNKKIIKENWKNTAVAGKYYSYNDNNTTLKITFFNKFRLFSNYKKIKYFTWDFFFFI